MFKHDNHVLSETKTVKKFHNSILSLFIITLIWNLFI